ncbi:glycosyltransferase [Mycolicibacterium litorale]|uniref:glycosyltransferase n=1 Tax=Mycolicibacterium litorale TaxID=758802 RepID=UPI0039A3C498
MIVVTYNSYEALEDIKASVSKFASDHPGNHAIVIENSQDHRIAESIGSEASSDRVHAEVAAHNEGFSHGVNLGYRLAVKRWGTFDYIVLLNPDVVSAGPVLCELVNRAASEAAQGVGISGPVLRDQLGHVDRGGARRMWNRRRFFCHLAGVPEFTVILGTAPRSLTDHEIATDQSQLAMISGGSMCITADVFGDGLNTLLPMYFEDQELCIRSRAKGFSVRLHADLELVHVGGVSRKSVTTHEQALRIMELVESPVICMHQLQGYRLPPLRAIVLLGGISRMAAAPLAALLKIGLRRADVREQVTWLSSQYRLASWYIRWAIKGKLHRKQVSLAEYFREYAPACK